MAKLTIGSLLFLISKRCLTTSLKSPLAPPLPQSTECSNFALHFLTNSCGLPLKSAISVSQKFQIQEKNGKRLQSVVDFFKGEGFTPAQIGKLIEKRPMVLHASLETTLKPKVEFLKQNGFVGEFLIELLAKNIGIIQESLDSQMKPSLELLRSYLGSDEKIVSAIRRSSWLLTMNVKRNMQPNIDFLVKEGVPAGSITKIINLKPRSIVQKLSRTIYVVNAVKKLGLKPSSPMFVHAYKAMISLSESTMKKKMELLQSFGWSEEEVFTALKRSPNVIAYSEGRIRKSMDFYLNTMKLNGQMVLAYPEILTYAVDTRVHPRYIILKILKSRKLIKENSMTFSWISMSDQSFLDKYVIKYEDKVTGLLDAYSGNRS